MLIVVWLLLVSTIVVSRRYFHIGIPVILAVVPVSVVPVNVRTVDGV